MQTCKMCGARLGDENEVRRHNDTMHPNMAKKGGLPSDERKPDQDRPID
jgi:hypothetical protein